MNNQYALGQLPYPSTPTTGLPYAPAGTVMGPQYQTPYGVVSPYGTAYSSPYSPYGASYYPPGGYPPSGAYNASLYSTTTFSGTTLLLGIGALAALYFFMQQGKKQRSPT